MPFMAYRSTISTPISGNAELQSLRILETIEQQLEMEYARSVSRSPDRYSFRGGFAGFRHDSTLIPFMHMVTCGEISISQAGNQHLIVYRIYFDELALVIFGVCAVFGILTLGSILKMLLIISLCIFLTIALITIIRFQRFLLSCLKQANA
jgi:hypothetical protein